MTQLNTQCTQFLPISFKSLLYLIKTPTLLTWKRLLSESSTDKIKKKKKPTEHTSRHEREEGSGWESATDLDSSHHHHDLCDVLDSKRHEQSSRHSEGLEHTNGDKDSICCHGVSSDHQCGEGAESCKFGSTKKRGNNACLGCTCRMHLFNLKPVDFLLVLIKESCYLIWSHTGRLFKYKAKVNIYYVH